MKNLLEMLDFFFGLVYNIWVTRVVQCKQTVYKNAWKIQEVVIMNIIEAIEKDYMKKEVPAFNVGDSVKVYVKVVEGTRERLQAFEGIVIAKKNGGVRETFTVRRVSFGVGIERSFPIHSPRIDRIEVVRKGKVRRAKLYYLRNLSGKAAKITEKI